MAYPFIVRRAVPGDREAVALIARAIAPDDWVPGAFDQFMAEQPPGGLYVAEQNGRVIGYYHLTLTERGDAHFSAMRMDPAVQGQGLGSLFCKAQVEQALQEGASPIYLLSLLENLPAHRTVGKNGFANLGEWVLYEQLPQQVTGGGGGTSPGEAALLSNGARQAASADGLRLTELRRRLAGDLLESVIAAPDSLWTLQTLIDADWQPQGWWVVDGGDGLAGAMLLTGAGSDLNIRRLEGTPAAAAELLAAAVAEVRRGGYQHLGASLPARCEPLLQPLRPNPATAFRGYVFRHP